ncbi:hypothetical protein [Spirosoma sp. KNUC1025]|uniref:hypothetical protein n=1 Tax=Spirosoma sp. KNUC1025 TaxID=2894082 RepID=UPI003866BBC7|nr:hypothetical protein LN737_25895 [Spirosoma sp. KNUC1025]
MIKTEPHRRPGLIGMTKGTKVVLFFLALAGLSWGVYKCKYAYSYYTDLKDRPWAYSEDEHAKLLVGTWQGTYQDPDNVAKTIRLEILVPMTDDERAAKAGKRSRRRSGLGQRKDNQHFDGLATVTSKLGKEEYEIYGRVGKDDWHQLKTVHFRVVDEIQQLHKNFGVGQAETGHWQDDQLTLTVGFVYTTATGSHSSDSADPRYDKKVTIHFSRKKS